MTFGEGYLDSRATSLLNIQKSDFALRQFPSTTPEFEIYLDREEAILDITRLVPVEETNDSTTYTLEKDAVLSLKTRDSSGEDGVLGNFVKGFQVLYDQEADDSTYRVLHGSDAKPLSLGEHLELGPRDSILVLKRDSSTAYRITRRTENLQTKLVVEPCSLSDKLSEVNSS